MLLAKTGHVRNRKTFSPYINYENIRKKVIGFGHFFALESKIVYLNGNAAVIWASAFSKVAERSEILAICCKPGAKW